MSLLVEYTLVEGKASEQVEALQKFIAGLKSLGDNGFDYTAYESDDPTKFFGVLDFEDDGAKQRFLDSAPFAEYRDGSKGRFVAPPNATPIRLVGSTRG
jgi:hypothetical protein